MIILDPIDSPTGWRMTYHSPAKMDKRDGKIISILQQNARVSIQDIAHYLHLSKAAVIYRINRLTDAGVIRGYTTHFRLFDSQYHYAIVCLQNKKGKLTQHQWMEELSKRKEVITVMSLYGLFNTLVGIAYKNKSQLNTFTHWCNSKGNTDIITLHEIDRFELTRLDYSNEKVDLTQVIQKNGVCFQEEFNHLIIKKMKTFSPLDCQIIMALHHGARQPITELARSCGIYKTTFKKRVKELIQSGVIAKFSADINPHSFEGIQFMAVWLSIKNEADQKKITEHIKNAWNGHGIAHLEGEWNMLVFLHFFTNEEIQAFENYLHTHLPSMENYQLFPIREQVKLDWIPNGIDMLKFKA